MGDNLYESSVEINIDDLQIVDENQDVDENQEETNEQPKRPRGRPRKERPEVEEPKRPRGRPPKVHVEPIEPPEPIIKNPVGRPKKIRAEPIIKNRVGRPRIKPIKLEKKAVGRPRTIESYDDYFRQYYHNKVKLKATQQNYIKNIIKEIIIEQLHD